VLVVSVDVTFTANGDIVHNHSQDILSFGSVAFAYQVSEWFRPGVVTGTFSVGGVGSTASGDGAMTRGKSTLVLQNFGPPFPHSN
jgi:hypothetical protein